MSQPNVEFTEDPEVDFNFEKQPKDITMSRHDTKGYTSQEVVDNPVQQLDTELDVQQVALEELMALNSPYLPIKWGYNILGEKKQLCYFVAGFCITHEEDYKDCTSKYSSDYEYEVLGDEFLMEIVQYRQYDAENDIDYIHNPYCYLTSFIGAPLSG